MTDFRAYQHVAHLGTPDVDGILDHACHVFPKLDGTNASIWFDDLGDAHFGSRKRELSEGKDNANFMNKFMFWKRQETALKFLQYLVCINGGKVQDYVIYGEYLIRNNIKTYDESAYHRFYVFDVYDRVNHRYLPFRDWRQCLVPTDDFGCIPCIGFFEPGKLTPEQIKRLVDEESGWLNDKPVGEGIVIKAYDFKNAYGHTVWAKVLSEDYRQLKAPKVTKEKQPVEEEIVAKYLRPSTIDKILVTLDWEPKLYPQLIERVWHDMITEEFYTILKKLKPRTIDFKVLKALVVEGIRYHVENR
jgi:hypothetical protein